MDEKEVYIVKEAVEILGISRDRIYEYLRSGHIRGTRVTSKSVWLSPRSEIDRLRGNIQAITTDKDKLEAARKALEDDYRRILDPVLAERRRKHWNELRELAGRVKNALAIPFSGELFMSHIPDYPSTYTFPEHFDVTMVGEDDERSVNVKLRMEGQLLFCSLLSHLKAEFDQFHQFEQWKGKLQGFVDRCHQLAASIYKSVESIAPIAQRNTGKDTGVFTDFPAFVYESVLRVVAEKALIPDLEVGSLQEMPILTPKGRPRCVMVRDNAVKIDYYRELFCNEVSRCLSEPLPGQIDELEQELKDWTNNELRPILTLVMARGTFEATNDCSICRGLSL